MQEYWRISSLSDTEVQYLDKQKIQDLVGGSILIVRTYSSYEVGSRSIPVETLGKIADIFDTSIDYLVGRTNVKSAYPKR